MIPAWLWKDLPSGNHEKSKGDASTYLDVEARLREPNERMQLTGPPRQPSGESRRSSRPGN
jgi:hypothetical protein